MPVPADPQPAPLPGPVLVVGAGLIGASVAMALERAGVTTYVKDVDAVVARVAASRGAGSDGDLEGSPTLVVVATPPDQLGAEILSALRSFPDAVVTDVGSVKVKPLDEVVSAGVDASRYVGGHPMAGSERSGPLASAADLFDGRTWAVTPHPRSSNVAVRRVEELATTCGGLVVQLSPEDHDLAVARTSHLPHLLSVLTAARLVDAPGHHLALTGQGLRDVTRIASGDPGLWQQIVSANAAPLCDLLVQVRADVEDLIASLESADAEGVESLLKSGRAGTAVIPGKHGGPSQLLATLDVHIPDQPGALARLFADARDSGVNIEDLRMDHDPGRAYGLIELDVSEDSIDVLVGLLSSRGWVVHR